MAAVSFIKMIANILHGHQAQAKKLIFWSNFDKINAYKWLNSCKCKSCWKHFPVPGNIRQNLLQAF